MIAKDNKCLWCNAELTYTNYLKCDNHPYMIAYKYYKNYSVKPATLQFSEIFIYTEDLTYKFDFLINKIQYPITLQTSAGFTMFNNVSISNIDDSFFNISYDELISKLKILTLFS